jgi:hypothetical protein
VSASNLEPAPTWLEPLVRLPVDLKKGGVSVVDLMRRAAPDLEDARLESLVRARLASEPALVDAWEVYAYDQRDTPSPYMDRTKVGFLSMENGRAVDEDVRVHDSMVDACADFIRREAGWVLEGRRLS